MSPTIILRQVQPGVFVYIIPCILYTYNYIILYYDKYFILNYY